MCDIKEIIYIQYEIILLVNAMHRIVSFTNPVFRLINMFFNMFFRVVVS